MVMVKAIFLTSITEICIYFEFTCKVLFSLRRYVGRGHNQSSFDLYFPRPVSDETKMRADASKDCLETHQNVTWLTIITILLTEESHSHKINISYST